MANYTSHGYVEDGFVVEDEESDYGSGSETLDEDVDFGYEIDWKRRLDGVIEQLLARGFQEKQRYITKKLKKCGPYGLTVKNINKHDICECCNMKRNLSYKLILKRKNKIEKLRVGSFCYQYMILAHKMMFFEDLNEDPQYLMDQIESLPGF